MSEMRFTFEAIEKTVYDLKDCLQAAQSIKQTVENDYTELSNMGFSHPAWKKMIEDSKTDLDDLIIKLSYASDLLKSVKDLYIDGVDMLREIEGDIT